MDIILYFLAFAYSLININQINQKTIIGHPINIEEIKTDLKPYIIRYMLSDCCIGRCFLDAFTKSACDIELLHKVLDAIYSY